MIFESKEKFVNKFEKQAEYTFGKSLSTCTDEERFVALARLVAKESEKLRDVTEERYLKEQKKHVYYFSAEFLIGRLLKNYLLNLGVLDDVAECLKEMGMDLEELCSYEKDPALGNGARAATR